MAVVREHRDFFRKNGWIEVDSILDEPELARLIEDVDAGLCTRLHTNPTRLNLIPADQQFMQGRDLWRTYSPLRKLIMSPQLALLGSELFGKHMLRYGYDVVIPPERDLGILKKPENTPLAKLLREQGTLNDLSALQGVVGGVFLCLEGAGTAPFPTKAGNGVFVRADAPLDFSLMGNARCLLIVYTLPTAVYVVRDRDPHLHTLKQWGFNFGDRLGDATHPIFRR